jgi:hypothetical protein
LDSLYKYHHFFAECGWRSSLTMGAGQHGSISPLIGQDSKLFFQV